MAVDYESIHKWGKILTYLASGCMIILGIAKFCNVMDFMNPIDYIVNIYMILLGVLFILCEIEWEKVLSHFNFLRYYLGKAFFCLFLGLLCFNKSKWFTILVGIIFWVVCAIYIILGVVFFNQEKGIGGNATVTKTVKEVKVGEVKPDDVKVQV